MPSIFQLAPQLVALVAAISVPVVFAYAGIKGVLRLWLAHRQKRSDEFWRVQKRWLGPVLLVNLCFVILFVYGWMWEAHWVERVDVTIPADVEHPLRVVHMSDLHLEGWGRRESKAIELARAADPDLVLLTGDYTSKGTGNTFEGDLRKFVSQLNAKTGVFAVPGNWDTDAARWFEGTDVVLLTGRSTRVEIDGLEIAITGGWYDMAPPRKDPEADFTIYLQHSPDFLRETSDAGYDLYLAGHTHGGQVRIPWFGAVITLSRFWKRYESGLFREGETYLYVNRGLGLEGGWAPRVRLFCRPEVTVIDVVPAG